MNISALNASTAIGHEINPQSMKEAAEAFEALFVGQLLKSAREARGSEGSGEDDNSCNSLMELADEHMAQQISRSGGCGLAKAILAQLSPGDR